MCKYFSILLLIIACNSSSFLMAAGVGDTAPPLISHKTYNSDHGKGIELKDYLGKVVLIDFWATWCGPCVKAMPHLNKLHDNYAEKGLVIIGQTDKSSKDIPGFIKSHRLKFLISVGEEVFDKNYGVTGIPRAALIDSKGTIIWMGHSATVSSKTIEKALKDVSVHALSETGYPGFDDSNFTSLRAIQSYAEKGKVGVALKRLDDLLEKKESLEAEELKEASATHKKISSWIEYKRKEAAAHLQKGDVYMAENVLDELSSDLRMHQLGKDLDKECREMRKDRNYRIGSSFYGVQKKLSRANDKTKKATYEKFAQKYADSYYGKAAEAFAQNL